MGADRAEMGSTVRTAREGRVARTWLECPREREGDGLECGKRYFWVGGERGGIGEGMEEEVNCKVGDIGGSGERAEVEKTTIKSRMLEKGMGERVIRRKKPVETLKDSDGMDWVCCDVKGRGGGGRGGV